MNFEVRAIASLKLNVTDCNLHDLITFGEYVVYSDVIKYMSYKSFIETDFQSLILEEFSDIISNSLSESTFTSDALIIIKSFNSIKQKLSEGISIEIC